MLLICTQSQIRTYYVECNNLTSFRKIQPEDDPTGIQTCCYHYNKERIQHFNMLYL